MASSDQTSHSEGTKSTGNTIKLLIEIQPDGAVVGINAGRWSSRTGHFIRSHIPVDIKDWRKVPKNFKDDVWNALMGEFELNISPELARPLLEKTFPQRFRSMKAIYRKQFLKKAESLEAATTCPPGVDPSRWANFVAREDKSEVKEANAKNSRNRKKNTVGHTLGRSSYARIHYNLQQKDPQKKSTRVATWYKGHKRTDGTVLESALDKYEQVKAVGEKRKIASTSGEGSSSQVDIDLDELTEVFGREPKGGVRGVGSHTSKKQLQQAAVATALLEHSKSTSYADMKAEIVAEVNSSLARFEGVLSAMFNHANTGVSNAQPPLVATTPRTEVGSNSINRPSPIIPTNLAPLLESLNNHSRSSTNPKVILLDRDGTPVGKGYVVTDRTSEICHGRKVGLGEKKVYVEEVLVGQAPIYDGSQDGNTLMQGLVEGGFLVWLEARLQLQ